MRVYRAQARDLLRLCREAERQQGYWLDSPEPHDSFSSLIFHESTASKLISYEPLLIPGLLQTPAYARVRISGGPQSPEEKDALVRIRMERRAILHRRYPTHGVFFIHEQALRLQVGSAAIMHEQMLHVVLMAALEQVTLRVVPSAAGAESWFGGSFLLMEYRDHGPLVYLENVRSGFFIEDREYVADYRKLVPDLSAVALDKGQSRKFAADLADEYDRRSQRRHAGIYELEEEHL